MIKRSWNHNMASLRCLRIPSLAISFDSTLNSCISRTKSRTRNNKIYLKRGKNSKSNSNHFTQNGRLLSQYSRKRASRRYIALCSVSIGKLAATCSRLLFSDSKLWWFSYRPFPLTYSRFCSLMDLNPDFLKSNLLYVWSLKCSLRATFACFLLCAPPVESC